MCVYMAHIMFIIRVPHRKVFPLTLTGGPQLIPEHTITSFLCSCRCYTGSQTQVFIGLTLITAADSLPKTPQWGDKSYTKAASQRTPLRLS